MCVQREFHAAAPGIGSILKCRPSPRTRRRHDFTPYAGLEKREVDAHAVSSEPLQPCFHIVAFARLEGEVETCGAVRAVGKLGESGRLEPLPSAGIEIEGGSSLE